MTSRLRPHFTHVALALTFKEQNMKNKIELYREARLWITKVIIPLAGMATLYFSNPDNRADFKSRFLKSRIEKKLGGLL
jgi:hypothetical protein